MRPHAIPMIVLVLAAPAARATVYYVSSATGNDANAGTSPTAPFATLARVNALALQPGDEVRLFCGETWRTDALQITRSGTASQPILYSTYPAGCANKPLLSGAWPVAGFVPFASNIYVADLAAGANAPRFPLGVNQVFRGTARLPMGRWPNIAGQPDGGYAEVDSEPSPGILVDAALPNVDWTGAALHIKGIRWYMLNRDVVSWSPSTLVLNEDAVCYGSSGCAQWGYFLNNHYATLDSEGEWYYDASTRRLYVFTTTGAPTDVEASAIQSGQGNYLGAITLGRHLQEHVTYVTVENLRIERWFDAGITTPTNLEADENQNVVIRGNEIRDVDTAGIRLATWVWDAQNNGSGPDGWRGGRNQLVSGNVIERANHFGIDTFCRDTEMSDNVIRDVARIENLGRSGMGCGNTGTNCTEHGAGVRLNYSPGSAGYAGHNNRLLRNRIERVGMQGIDSFGPYNRLENNVIDQPCISKGDCGGIRTFGSNDLASTQVYDVTITGNVIRHVLGNTDGCAPQFEDPFGLGIYIDNYSRNVTVTGNTVIGSTWTGLLYQSSTGTATGNTLYDNLHGNEWAGQLNVVGSVSLVTSTGNIFLPLAQNRPTMRIDARSSLFASDGNRFFSPYEAASIVSNDAGGPMTLAQWQAFSGRDGASTAHWYTQAAGETPRSRILVNDTAASKTFPLGPGNYRRLDQSPAGSSVTLAPFTSLVLIGDAAPAGQIRAFLTGEGHGPANANRVRVHDETGTLTAVDFLAYGAGSFGTNVGSGNLQGGPLAEILTGPGPGAVFGPQVRAFDRTAVPIAKVNFYAYGTLRYGANVSSAELEGDGWDEILTGPGPGDVFGPHVRGFNFDALQVSAISKLSFYAYGTLKYGVNVEDGDLDGDALGEILTGPGPGQVFGAQVRGFNFDGVALAAMAKVNFVALPGSYGANVAGGDVEFDLFDEIAAGAGAGFPSMQDYRGFDYDGTAVAALTGFAVTPPGGTRFGGRVSLGDVNGDWSADLLTAPGPGTSAPASVRLYAYDGSYLDPGVWFTAFSSLYGCQVNGALLGY